MTNLWAIVDAASGKRSAENGALGGRRMWTTMCVAGVCWLLGALGNGSTAQRDLAELRLTPDILAAAGFSPVEANALCLQVRQSPQVLQQLAASRSRLHDAQNLAHELAWSSRLNPSDEQLAVHLSTVRATLAEARQAFESAQRQAIAAICSTGPSSAGTACGAAVEQERFDDAAFLVSARSRPTSRSLRMAEIHSRRCQRLSVPVSPLAAEALMRARSRPEYSAARHAVLTNHAAIAAALAGQ